MAGLLTRVLTLNAGSSSLKAHIVEGERAVDARSRDWTGEDRGLVLAQVLAELTPPGSRIDAVAHRVVHGGERFVAPSELDDAAVAAIEEATELAPLHNGPAIETIRAARDALPGVPHVACFDTAFHATLHEVARSDPIPAPWHVHGVRRYGFHGHSDEWETGRAAELLHRPVGELRMVVAHLGGGASVTAVDRGRSAWSSMGWTPNDGIMMGTRSGALDPAIVTAMIRRGSPVEEVDAALEREAGLRGVSGRSGDVRELEAAAARGDAAARLALDLFAARAAAGIAAAASWLPVLDAVVFTGGIGEHAAGVRAAIVERLAVLGVERSAAPEPRPTTPELVVGGDAVIAAGPPAVIRVEAREELVMARAATRLLVSPRG